MQNEAPLQPISLGELLNTVKDLSSNKAPNKGVISSKF